MKNSKLRISFSSVLCSFFFVMSACGKDSYAKKNILVAKPEASAQKGTVPNVTTNASQNSNVTPVENKTSDIANGIVTETMVVQTEAAASTASAAVPLLQGLEGTQEALAVVAEPESIRLLGSAENACSLSVALRYEHFGFKKDLNLVAGFAMGAELSTLQQGNWTIPLAEKQGSKSLVRNFASIPPGTIRLNTTLTGLVETVEKRSALEDFLLSISALPTAEFMNVRSSGGKTLSNGQGRQPPWLTAVGDCVTCKGPSASIGTGDGDVLGAQSQGTTRKWHHRR